MAGVYGMSFAAKLLEKGKYDEAIVEATKAIEKEDDNPEHFFERARADVAGPPGDPARQWLCREQRPRTRLRKFRRTALGTARPLGRHAPQRHLPLRLGEEIQALPRPHLIWRLDRPAGLMPRVLRDGR